MEEIVVFLAINQIIEILVIGENKDFKQTLKLRSEEQNELVKDALMEMNSKNSRDMLIYHLLTISPFKSLKYGVSKLLKGWKK